MSQAHWVIVETKSSSEEVAERSFREAGYRVYLPRYRKLLLPHGRMRKATTALRPLFSRLLFAQDWRGWPAQSITGTIGLMQASRAGGLAKLSDADVALIMGKERACEFDDVKYPPGKGVFIREDIKPGDQVEGEWFGQMVMGVLHELSDDGKATVKAMMFGRETPIPFPDADALQLVAS